MPPPGDEAVPAAEAAQPLLAPQQRPAASASAAGAGAAAGGPATAAAAAGLDPWAAAPGMSRRSRPSSSGSPGSSPVAEAAEELKRMRGRHAAGEVALGRFAMRLERAAGSLAPGQYGDALRHLADVSDSPAARRLLRALTVRVRSGNPIGANKVGNALFGLRRFSDSPEAREAVAALTPLVRSCPSDLDGRAAGMALYGTSQIGATPESLELVGAVAERAAGAGFSARHGATALFGLNRYGDAPEVRAAVRVITAGLLSDDAEDWTGQAVANALHGLRRVGASAEARRALALIARGARRGLRRFTPHELGLALMGLGTQGPTAEARAVLRAILPAARRAADAADALTTGSCLYGLRGQTDGSPELRQFVALLAQRTATSPFPPAQWTPTLISMTAYGLAGMQDTVETQDLIAVLAQRAAGSAEKWTHRDIANALYGLRFAEDSGGVRALLAAVCERTAAAAREGFSTVCLTMALIGLWNKPGPEAQSIADALIPAVHTCAFDAAAAACGLYGMAAQHDSPAVRAVIAAAARAIPRCGLSALQVAMALYGLQRQTVEHSATAELLSCIAQAAARCPQMPDSAIAAAFYGLNDMLSTPQVLAVISALTMHLRSAESVSAASAAGVMLGLRSCSDQPETRAVIRELAGRVSALDSLSFREVAACLYGANSQLCSDELCELQSALADKITAGIPEAELADGDAAKYVGMAMYGFRRQSDAEPIRRLLHAITPSMAATKLSAATMANTFFGMRRLGDTAGVRAMLQVLAEKVAEHEGLPAHELKQCLVGLRTGGAGGLEARTVLQSLAGAVGKVTGDEVNVFGMSSCMSGILTGEGNSCEPKYQVRMHPDLVLQRQRSAGEWMREHGIADAVLP
eukprot:TRINITY_DN33647_c0_g1_i1.p1 TRINITY_DN33647_c0_g1~~TRINITY_DN33647_c0_g1_i1.p1  ORF type:complete len:870 (+),score=226.46 TRINITY_DN33647_c0_g1_i1:76-2685(+)